MEQQIKFDESLDKTDMNLQKEKFKKNIIIEKDKAALNLKNAEKKLERETHNKKHISERKRRSNESENWFRLDNAALIYPAIGTDNWNSVFRISAYLKTEVKPDVLEKALNDIMPRFPHLNVYIKRGMFWYYFEQLSTTLRIVKETSYPCTKFHFSPNSPLFRLISYHKKVIIEFFHSLTDGYGATCFLTALLSRYFILLGENINLSECPINYLDMPTEEEHEDAFARYADLKESNKWKEKKAFQVKGTIDDQLNIIAGTLSADAIHKVAKEHNASITQFLLATYFKALLNDSCWHKTNKKPVKISVPVNLRSFFETKTLRNFSSYVNLSFEPEAEAMSIDELIAGIKDQMRIVTRENFMRNINANVKAEHNLALRITPLLLKNIAMKLSYGSIGEVLYTSVLSNLGRIKVPSEFSSLVDRYEAIHGPNSENALTCAIISVGDALCISFSTTIKETRIERDFFRILTNFGIDITIDTNMLNKGDL